MDSYGPKENLLKQYDYHCWANKQVFNHLKTLPASMIHQVVQSVFPTITTVLVHIYFTEVIWFKVLNGETFEAIDEYANRSEKTKVVAEKNLDEIQALFRDLELNYRKFFEATDLTKTFTVLHLRFGHVTIPIFELIQHLVNHGSYHRGNLTAMLRQLSCKGVSTDYLIYLIQSKNKEFQ